MKNSRCIDGLSDEEAMDVIAKQFLQANAFEIALITHRYGGIAITELIRDLELRNERGYEILDSRRKTEEALKKMGK